MRAIVVALLVTGCGSRVEETSAASDAGTDTSTLVSDTAIAYDVPTPAVDLTCPSGHLPTAGTACDTAAMYGHYCRLASCGYGCEAETYCKDGLWVATESCRDGVGCGTSPLCSDGCETPIEDAGPVDTSLDTADPTVDADPDACAPPKVWIRGQPWSDFYKCYGDVPRNFECVDGVDGGTVITCFVEVSSMTYWITNTTHIPSGPDYRLCTDEERAAHPIKSCI